jgi:hypothetical protein
LSLAVKLVVPAGMVASAASAAPPLQAVGEALGRSANMAQIAQGAVASRIVV